MDVVLQAELLGGVDPRPAFAAAGVTPRFFDGRGDWRGRLAEIEAQLDGRRALVFCALGPAAEIRRRRPGLARGLLLDVEPLAWHRWSGLLPADWLLNRSAVLVPFGRLADRGADLRAIYGERVFLRPDSPLKTFPGLVVPLERLEAEISALRQLHAVHDDALVVVDRARDIAGVEWRFWLVDGEIVTCAPYALDPENLDALGPCPRDLGAMAARVARRIESHMNAAVADLVLDETGAPRLVEFNAPSTSGWHPRMDPVALVAALDELFVD